MTQHTRTAGRLRRVVASTAAALAATVLVAGCATGSDPVAPATGAAPTPKDALLAAVPEDTDGRFRFAGKDSDTDLSGLVDPAAKGVELTMAVKDAELGLTTRMTFRVVSEQVWMKVKFTGGEGLTGLPKLPDRWLELDRAKLTDAEAAPVWDGADVGNAGPLIEAATAVEEKGDRKYAGTIDLTAGAAAEVLEAEQMTALGAAAKAVPFTAEVGPDGNLSRLTLQVPAAGERKAYAYVVEYSDYGSAPQVTAPTGAAAQKAPKAAYDLLNG
ncbi:hypothetical protein ACFY2R_14075 [Micromonospora olivasterospora]|uniref:Lipoprotein n=1 Tax=Micromonospora olivasterospora TaxID=1880 RepID=A0A562I7F9_MICOL|nr:hypothetical protein [Micromonospora olivasterospora]TWH66708.1 hypothetical protein JD77_01666 [Micromonospora olivasterospora]